MRQDRIAPLLVDYLLAHGIRYEDIVFLIANGTHRPHSEEEKKRIVSEELFEKVSVIDHDCESADLCYLGRTSRGTPVWVNPLAVGRKVITIGATIHHLMSGFSGGRKSILPGICGETTIEYNHLHALDPKEACSNPLIGSGVLENNPVHLDMTEAAGMLNPCFSIHLLAGADGYYDILCGHWYDAWLQSCHAADRLFGVPIGERADITVVSCGGYPKDINLYQSVKSLLNAGLATKDGGTILMLAECREGGGPPEFFSWIEPLSQGRLDEALRENFGIAGYIFYAACEELRRTKTVAVTLLPREHLIAMGITPAGDAKEATSLINFKDKTVYVMPHAGNTVPVIKRS